MSCPDQMGRMKLWAELVCFAGAAERAVEACDWAYVVGTMPLAR